MKPASLIPLALLATLFIGCSPAAQSAASDSTSTVEQVSPLVTDTAAQEATSAYPASNPLPTMAYPENWQDFPVVPEVSARAIQIYQQGVQSGADPHRFSKIGDCQNITTYFLAAFEDPNEFSLGDEYAGLQDTIDWYDGSFSRESLAVAGGLNVARVLSPLNADPQLCEPNENSLACEVRLNNPSIALVSLEENWNKRNAEDYEKHLRTIVDYLISKGVLPILATKADNLEGDNSINATIAKVAVEYQLPLWNFWRAAQPLPNHGMEEDDFHLTQAGSFFDDPAHMRAGWAWRNLTALQTLDAVHRAVDAQ